VREKMDRKSYEDLERENFEMRRVLQEISELSVENDYEWLKEFSVEYKYPALFGRVKGLVSCVLEDLS